MEIFCLTRKLKETDRWSILENYATEVQSQPVNDNGTGPDITRREVENALKSVKDGKAGGRDEVAVEMLKAMEEQGIERITDLCNIIYNTGNFPRDLKESMFITLPKSRSVNEVEARSE